MEEGKGPICMRIHVQEGHRLMAACDRTLLGKEFSEHELKLKVSESFYNDEFVDKDTFLRFLETCDMANLVGEIVVGAAAEVGLIDPENVLKIEGIPHAQLCQA